MKRACLDKNWLAQAKGHSKPENAFIRFLEAEKWDLELEEWRSIAVTKTKQDFFLFSSNLPIIELSWLPWVAISSYLGRIECNLFETHLYFGILIYNIQFLFRFDICISFFMLNFTSFFMLDFTSFLESCY